MKIPALRAENLGNYFYKLAERSQDIFWIRSSDFQTLLYINPAYEKIWGKPCQALYENPASWMVDIYAADRDMVAAKLKRIIAQPEGQEFYLLNYRIIRPDKEIRWIQEMAFPLI